MKLVPPLLLHRSLVGARHLFLWLRTSKTALLASQWSTVLPRL